MPVLLPTFVAEAIYISSPIRLPFRIINIALRGLTLWIIATEWQPFFCLPIAIIHNVNVMQQTILFKCKGRPSRTPLRVISGFSLRQSAQTFSLSSIAARIYSGISAGISARISAGSPARIAARIADAATTPSAAVASVIIGAIAIWSALAIAPTMLQAQSAIAYIFILLLPWWIAAGVRSIAMTGESSKGGDK